jgi:glutamate-ammonia-ligase adenylyltransferase
LSDIAEVLIRALAPLVEEEFGRRHGRVPGGGMAVVGFGRLGGREMTAGSDLDLIFVYDFPPEVEASDGAKPLAVGHYYTRLGQRFIAALTALTAEGRLYDVDMRLRPSGKAGPIATSLHAFELYQRESAWTWEHMALTRARVISGPKPLAAAIPGVIRRVLTRPRDPDQLLGDVAEMRERVEREHGTSNPWNVKHARGGLLDLEFISQYLQLRHAADRPEVLDANTSAAFRRLKQTGGLDAAAADELIAATALMQNVQGLSRLSSEAPIDEESVPAGLRQALARAGGAADFDALKHELLAAQMRTLDHYRRLIEAPARARLAARAQEKQP